VVVALAGGRWRVEVDKSGAGEGSLVLAPTAEGAKVSDASGKVGVPWL